jgi:hypothetical protein
MPARAKSRPIALLAVAMLASTFAGMASASPRIYPTGVTIYDPARAYSSFICFGAPDGGTHLIDMDGNEVRRWPRVGLPGEVIDPKLIGGQRGHVFLQLSDGPDRRGGIFSNKTVGELDWDGKTVWEWGTQAPGGMARQNHDWARLPNGNTTLLLVTIPHAVEELRPKELGDQGICEVDPGGAIVWKWVAGEHRVRVFARGTSLPPRKGRAQPGRGMGLPRNQRLASGRAQPLV